MARDIHGAPSAEQQTGDRGQARTPEALDTLSPQQLKQAGAAHRGYYRWLRLSRFAIAAFFFMAALLILWLLPWLPTGLQTDDYTPELAFTVYLLGGVAIAGVLTLALRQLAQRDRESLMVWTAVYDEATGLHNRSYLYDRLSLECERAERTGCVFSVIVLQIRAGSVDSGARPTVSDSTLQEVSQLLDRLTRRTDLVALLSGSELAILTIGTDGENPRNLLNALRAAVAGELSRLLDASTDIRVIGGLATYGVHGNEPGTLVQGARAAATQAMPGSAKTA